MEASAMKLALVLLSLVAFNSISLHAQITGDTKCASAISKVSHPSTPELWRGLAKNSRDLYAVTDTLRENRRIMEEAAEAGKSFEVIRAEASKKGFPFGTQNIPYYERVYLKMYIAKNCSDTVLEAGASSPHDPVAEQGRVSIPNDDFFGHQVDDVTRGLGPAPGTVTPAETER
jgi:hypothetical protein